MLVHNKAYEELKNSQKYILFVMDRDSSYNVVRDDVFSGKSVYINFYDGLKTAIREGSYNIVTPCVSLLSFDLLDKGYRIFVMRKKKVLELHLGEVESCSKELRRSHNILKLLMGGTFDSYWEDEITDMKSGEYPLTEESELTEIVWHSYPEEKPTKCAEYLTSHNGKITIQRWLSYDGFEFAIEKWAERPNPYKEET